MNRRRAALIACLVQFVIAPAVAQAQPARLEVRGKQLYVERLGPASAPAVLYLHGGPGTGAYDFTLHQGGRLTPALQLVAMDQRGVLRSDPLNETEAFGLEDLIEDSEALRRALGIDRWVVLGHSFGGYLAVRYALKYPASVIALVLESPTLDLGSSARSLLRRAAAEYRALGRTKEADACLSAAAAPTASDQVWAEFTRLSNGLGPARNNLYVHGSDKAFFDALVAESPVPREWWRRQNLFQQRLYAEKRVFESLLPMLSSLRTPALLIKGRYDPVAADDQIDAFRRGVAGGRVIEFERSGHFVHVEEAAAFARTVIDFVATVLQR